MISCENTDKYYKVSLCTLGCKVNQYESQAIAEDFTRLGFLLCDFEEDCDVYVINTCTVTAESDRKSRQMIRRAVQHTIDGHLPIVIAAGCYTQTQAKEVLMIDGITAVFGNTKKSRIAETAMELLKNRPSSPLSFVEPFESSLKCEKTRITHSERTRAFVKIVDGCENHCSYCTIPAARGPVRSRAISEIIEELQGLAANGYREIVLTGIETASYGKDLEKDTLPVLLNECDKIQGIERIRLGSLEPTILKEPFLKAVSETRHVVPHFHLSLQSGCSAVLRRMRRKYNAEQFAESIASLRESIPDVTFTTDVIVGFPGETIEMFEETCRFVRDCRFLYVHIFPYSVRSGTEAATMSDQIDESEKKRRASILKKVMLETRLVVLRSFDGKPSSVLVEERDHNGDYIGHTPQYIEVCLRGTSDNTENLHNQLIPVTLKFEEGNTDYMIGIVN